MLMDANFWCLLASWPRMALGSWVTHNFVLLFSHAHVLLQFIYVINIVTIVTGSCHCANFYLLLTMCNFKIVELFWKYCDVVAWTGSFVYVGPFGIS